MRSDKGKYSGKHPVNTTLDPLIVDAVKEKSRNAAISCGDAENISLERNKSLLSIGTIADMLEITIDQCQLGLFGYGTKKKVVIPAKTVSSDLEKAIRRQLDNERLTCQSAWKIAEEMSLSKMSVAAACEALQIKIVSCQLGAF
jgi:hypothetical protein